MTAKIQTLVDYFLLHDLRTDIAIETQFLYRYILEKIKKQIEIILNQSSGTYQTCLIFIR